MNKQEALKEIQSDSYQQHLMGLVFQNLQAHRPNLLWEFMKESKENKLHKYQLDQVNSSIAQMKRLIQEGVEPIEAISKSIKEFILKPQQTQEVSKEIQEMILELYPMEKVSGEEIEENTIQRQELIANWEELGK